MSDYDDIQMYKSYFERECNDFSDYKNEEALAQFEEDFKIMMCLLSKNIIRRK